MAANGKEGGRSGFAMLLGHMRMIASEPGHYDAFKTKYRTHEGFRRQWQTDPKGASAVAAREYFTVLGFEPEQVEAMALEARAFDSSPHVVATRQQANRRVLARRLVENGALTEGLRDGESASQITGSAPDDVLQSTYALWEQLEQADLKRISDSVTQRRFVSGSEQLTLEQKTVQYQQWLVDHGFDPDPMNQK